MSTTEDLRGFEARLLTELRGLVDPMAEASPAPTPLGRWRMGPARPTVRRRLVVVALMMATLALVVAPSLLAPHRSSAFAVTQLADGRIHVEVASDFDQSARLQAELADVGVAVDVLRLSAHPRLVGTIELVPLGEAGISAAGAAGLEVGRGEFWVDPRLFRGSVEVLIYASPEDGEHWQASPSIFYPDEPLGGLPCALEGPVDTATLERYARQVGISRFEWLVPPPTHDQGSFEVDRPSERPAGDVLAASMMSPEELRVTVAPPAAGGTSASPPSMDLGVHTGEQAVCTPELAARWR